MMTPDPGLLLRVIKKRRPAPLTGLVTPDMQARHYAAIDAAHGWDIGAAISAISAAVGVLVGLVLWLWPALVIGIASVAMCLYCVRRGELHYHEARLIEEDARLLAEMEGLAE